MEKVTFTVKGMTCMGCVRSVKNVLEMTSGVSGVAITLESGKAEIEYDNILTNAAQLAKAITEAGYEVVK